MGDRKVISIVSTDRYGLVALCDDGTVWILLGSNGWQQLPRIPQAN